MDDNNKNKNVYHGVVIERKISLGHILQILVIIAALIGGYYATQNSINTNKINIKNNTQQIVQLKQQSNNVLKQIEQQGQRREDRLDNQISHLQDDIDWLVHHQADNKDNNK